MLRHATLPTRGRGANPPFFPPRPNRIEGGTRDREVILEAMSSSSEEGDWCEESEVEIVESGGFVARMRVVGGCDEVWGRIERWGG